MRALSLESLRAYVLKKLDLSYKELEEVVKRAKKTLVYHFQKIRETFPSIDEEIEKRITTIPETLEEKIELASRIAQDLYKELKEKEEGEEDEREEKEEEAREEEVSAVSEIKLEGEIRNHPYLLLDAIERSVQARGGNHLPAVEFEEEEEKEGKKVEGSPKKGDFLLFLGGALAFFALFALASKSPNTVPKSPNPTPNSPVLRPSRPFSRRIKRLALRGGIA